MERFNSMGMNAEFQHINLEYLQKMTEGDRALERDMLQVLVKELQTEVPKMRALHAARDWRPLAEVSHRLKSSLAYAGNADLTKINSEIELFADRGQDMAALPELLAGLERMLPAVLAELQAAAARLGGTA
jgi:HPt (histidine-containing phosphotransfer) domain-containing protein